MLKERLERLIAEVLEEFGRNIVVSNLHQNAKNTAITVYLVSNASNHGFADSLAPIVFDWLDWERDEEITGRLGKHIADYLAAPAKA